MRYVVVGTSGAGKSVFARKLADRTSSKYIELDAHHWAANWTPRAPEDFRSFIRAETDAERWVSDGNYTVVRDVLWPRATHVIWLNFDRFTVFSRVIKRTLVRTITKQPLWAGNRESFSKAFLSRESILLWSFTTFDKNRRKFRDLRSSSKYDHLSWHELRSPREAAEFLQSITAHGAV